MPVHIKCGGCKKILKGPDHLAGKKVKCPHCGATLQIPPAETEGAPAATQPPPEDSLKSLLDEEGFTATPTTTSARINACPGCGVEMPPGGVLCVNCGFHKELGQKLETKHGPSAADEALARARQAIAEEQRRSPIKESKMNPTVQAWIMGGIGAVVLIGILVVGFSMAGGAIDPAACRGAFLAFSGLLVLGGRIAIVVIAAGKGDVASAIGCFCCDPYALVYSILNFQECKFALAAIAVGYGLAGVGGAIGGGE
jgi:hypothetical protein